MKKAEIEWYKYPEEKPKVVDVYMVTINYGFFNTTSSAVWNGERFMEDEDESSRMFPIIAWAEMPEPYQEGSNE